MATYDQINDAMVHALRKDLYTGQLNDMLIQWLRAEGAVGIDLMRLWEALQRSKYGAFEQGREV